jgi:2,3,4,5-tetrahydropyridine-2-carboxylate N-succinyltransferase
MPLKDEIELYYSQDSSALDRDSALRAFNELKFFLNQGEVRAAQPSEGDGSKEGWVVNSWVKKGIILGFRLGTIRDYSPAAHFRYFDKNTFPLKALSPENGVRIVPGGTSLRDGCYVASGVVIMPPAYINVGAYVDDGTMVVVENGRHLIGQTLDVVVTSILQTTAGRMIFTKKKENGDSETRYS